MRGHSPDNTGEFVEWLHAKVEVYGHAYRDASDVWFDIGTIEQIEEARDRWEGLGA